MTDYNNIEEDLSMVDTEWLRWLKKCVDAEFKRRLNNEFIELDDGSRAKQTLH